MNTYKISDTIRSSLTQKLSKARKTIKANKDIYLDSDHEQLCLYYKKYQELMKQFNTKKTKITYETLKLDKHILSQDHTDDLITFKNNNITIDLLYNEYNKKFINKLYVLNDVSYYEEWIKEQNTFIKSLSPEEIYTLRCHTHDGDVIVNYFINNNFKIDIDIDLVDNGYRKSKIVVDKKQFNTNRNFILFYYQIKKYLYSLDNSYKSLSRIELETYIIENYTTFDWNKILILYIKDIKNIFKKSPKIQDTIVIYRGVNDEYYLKNSTKGVFNSQTLSSYTLDHKTAISYADRNCCIMRVKLNKGCKAILIDNISPYNEAEILLPFDTKYNIDYPRHLINYYKQNEICPDDTRSKKIMVTDLSVIRSLSSKSTQSI
tara:strand:- start:407 stop:1534 length:1128 start_codon:yes stop_codon:yes gene_type:complete